MGILRKRLKREIEADVISRLAVLRSIEEIEAEDDEYSDEYSYEDEYETDSEFEYETESDEDTETEDEEEESVAKEQSFANFWNKSSLLILGTRQYCGCTTGAGHSITAEEEGETGNEIVTNEDDVSANPSENIKEDHTKVTNPAPITCNADKVVENKSVDNAAEELVDAIMMQLVMDQSEVEEKIIVGSQADGGDGCSTALSGDVTKKTGEPDKVNGPAAGSDSNSSIKVEDDATVQNSFWHCWGPKPSKNSADKTGEPDKVNGTAGEDSNSSMKVEDDTTVQSSFRHGLGTEPSKNIADKTGEKDKVNGTTAGEDSNSSIKVEDDATVQSLIWHGLGIEKTYEPDRVNGTAAGEDGNSSIKLDNNSARESYGDLMRVDLDRLSWEQYLREEEEAMTLEEEEAMTIEQMQSLEEGMAVPSGIVVGGVQKKPKTSTRKLLSTSKKPPRLFEQVFSRKNRRVASKKSSAVNSAASLNKGNPTDNKTADNTATGSIAKESPKVPPNSDEKSTESTPNEATKTKDIAKGKVNAAPMLEIMLEKSRDKSLKSQHLPTKKSGDVEVVTLPKQKKKKLLEQKAPKKKKSAKGRSAVNMAKRKQSKTPALALEQQGRKRYPRKHRKAKSYESSKISSISNGETTRKVKKKRKKRKKPFKIGCSSCPIVCSSLDCSELWYSFSAIFCCFEPNTTTSKASKTRRKKISAKSAC